MQDRAFATEAELRPTVLIDRYLSRAAVCAMVGFGQTVLYQEVKAGRFPRPRKISKRRRGWLLSQVQDFIRTREAA